MCCPPLGHLRAVLSRLRRDRTIRRKNKTEILSVQSYDETFFSFTLVSSKIPVFVMIHLINYFHTLVLCREKESSIIFTTDEHGLAPTYPKNSSWFPETQTYAIPHPCTVRNGQNGISLYKINTFSRREIMTRKIKINKRILSDLAPNSQSAHDTWSKTGSAENPWLDFGSKLVNNIQWLVFKAGTHLAAILVLSFFALFLRAFCRSWSAFSVSPALSEGISLMYWSEMVS